MCGLNAAEIHEQPFRATKEIVQPLTAQDFVLPYGKKILISGHWKLWSTLGAIWEHSHAMYLCFRILSPPIYFVENEIKVCSFLSNNRIDKYIYLNSTNNYLTKV